MDIAKTTNDMFKIAKSEMTKKEKYWSILKDDIERGYTTLEKDGTYLVLDTDGSLEDVNFAEEPTQKEIVIEQERLCRSVAVKQDPESICLYFCYEFDKGHMRRDSPKKFIPSWDAAFDYDYDDWEARVCERLSKLVKGYPYAWIDSDSDFGYQAFTLYISKMPKPSYY